MVELFEHVRHDVFQVVQIDNHAGHGIDLPAKGHFKQIVVPVFLGTGAEDPSIAFLVPLGLEIPVGSGKFYSFRESRSCHARMIGIGILRKRPGVPPRGRSPGLVELEEAAIRC